MLNGRADLLRRAGYVRIGERSGTARGLAAVWLNGSINPVTMAVGAIGIHFGSDPAWAALAIILGCLIGSLSVSGLAAQGARLGLPQLIQARGQLGRRGGMIVSAGAIAAYLGFASVGAGIAGDAVHVLTDAPRPLGVALCCVFAALLASLHFGPFQAAHRWMGWLLAAGLAVYGLAAFRALPPWAPGDFRLQPFLAQFGAATAYQLSWGLYLSDYSRHLPPRTGRAGLYWWTFAGSMTGGSATMLAGAASLADAPAGHSLAQALSAVGRHAGLIWALLSVVPLGALNIGGAALAIGAAFPALDRWLVPVLSGLCTLLGLAVENELVGGFAAFLDRFTDFLAPWTGIIVADLHFGRRGRYSAAGIVGITDLYGNWNPRGLGALAFGGLVSAFAGPASGGLAAAAIYAAIHPRMNWREEMRRIDCADRSLDPL